MNSWDFTDAKLKVKRAKYHLESFNFCMSDWVKNDPSFISIKKDIDAGCNVLKFDITKSVPEDIALIAGDIVHNLRSALDYIAVEIVRKSGKGISDVHFPFHETFDGLITMLGDGKLCRASPEAAAIIIEEIKPYPDGNRFIWSLNRLSNTDKHRLLVPTLLRVNFPEVSIKDSSKVEPVIANFIIESNDAIESAIIGSDSLNLEINSYGTPSYDIFFDERHVKGVPMLHIPRLLTLCATLVEGYISMFERI